MKTRSVNTHCEVKPSLFQYANNLKNTLLMLYLFTSLELNSLHIYFETCFQYILYGHTVFK